MVWVVIFSFGTQDFKVRNPNTWCSNCYATDFSLGSIPGQLKEEVKVWIACEYNLTWPWTVLLSLSLCSSSLHSSSYSSSSSSSSSSCSCTGYRDQSCLLLSSLQVTPLFIYLKGFPFLLCFFIVSWEQHLLITTVMSAVSFPVFMYIKNGCMVSYHIDKK